MNFSNLKPATDCREIQPTSPTYNYERRKIAAYIQAHNMTWLEDSGRFYVKTEFGLWMILFSHNFNKYSLFHANDPYLASSLEDAPRAKYHAQNVHRSIYMIPMLEYLYKHDEYKRRVAEAGGDERKVKCNKKFEKSQAKRIRRADQLRLEEIFRTLHQTPAAS